ncbi:hypothetical protein [Streptosporangium vulgare]|uniref:hypothetical protein n=1 Tax=Streptosporangium vulgare TaxID=46190 RepID=UPI0031E2A086
MNEVSCRGRSRLPEQAQNHGPPSLPRRLEHPRFTKADGGETGDGMLRRTPPASCGSGDLDQTCARLPRVSVGFQTDQAGGDAGTSSPSATCGVS